MRLLIFKDKVLQTLTLLSTKSSTSCALDGLADADIETMRVAFEKRRDMAYEMLNAVEGLSVIKPEGAYLYINTKSVEVDSMLFCQNHEEKGVA